MMNNILKVAVFSMLCTVVSTSCFNKTEVFKEFDQGIFAKGYFSNNPEISSEFDKVPDLSELEAESKKAISKPWKLRKKDKMALAVGTFDACLLANSYIVGKILGGDYMLHKEDFGALAGLAVAGFLVGAHTQITKNSAADKYKAICEKNRIAGNFEAYRHGIYEDILEDYFGSGSKRWKKSIIEKE